MAVKIVGFAAIVAQLIAAYLALRINRKYPRRSAWVLISAAAAVMAIERTAWLINLWDAPVQALHDYGLWTIGLSSLLVSVMLLGGIAMVEPLFAEIAEAQRILRRDMRRLERAVQLTEGELRAAAEIQRSLLPQASPRIEGFDLAGHTWPAEWTSGDYYDYIPLPDGRLLIVLADVSGHGTGPALLMTETRALLRSLAESSEDINDILETANRTIARDAADGRFVAMFLALLDPGARSLTYQGFGHRALLIREGGPCVPLDPLCPPLGAVEDLVPPPAPRVLLHPGDALLLATDGLLERRSPGGEQFGEERAVEVLCRHAADSAEHVVQALFLASQDFAGDAPRHDDVTVLILKATKMARAGVGPDDKNSAWEKDAPESAFSPVRIDLLASTGRTEE